MRALLLCAGLAVGCRAAPAWEPVGGFELVERPGAGWSELAPRALERRLAEAHAKLAPVRDYTAVLESRERIEDELYPRRVMRLKVRHAPFSVAIETDEPANEQGQRAWYDASWNDGEMMAETPGFLGTIVGRLSLDPEGDLALENRRHPITDTGLLRLIEQVEEAFAPHLADRVAPRLREAALSLGGRPATLVEALVSREAPDPPLVYRLAFDDEEGWLVYYGLAELLPDGPALVEEYLYRDIRVGLGLQDADFRPQG